MACHELSEIPETIQVFRKRFVLIGAIIFNPPPTNNVIGHYRCAIKINQEWDIHDDLVRGPRKISPVEPVAIQTIFYITKS